MGVLDGVVVLDLSRVFAAPLATQMLSDLGAEVWKIEAFRGDDSRKWGEHVFNAFNRGKKSLAINLKDPRAQDILRRLALKADVLIENFKTGDLARYGLSYEALAKDNPRLVYLSLTGFGNTGPRAHQPGYDTIIQAMTGVMTATGDPEGPPTRVGVAWIDVMSGLTSTIGILAALHERSSSGRGQHIDLSLFDVGMMALVDMAQDYLQNGNIQMRSGNITRNLSPAQVFKTSDGWIVIAVGNDDQFVRMAQAMKLPELTTDPRFSSNLLRVKNRGALSDQMIPVLEQAGRDEWVRIFAEAKVPVSPIFNIGEAVEDRQAKARGAVWQVPDGAGGELPMVANPLRHMSRTPAAPAGVPPKIGQHSGQILQEQLGLSAEEVAVLARDGVIQPGAA